MATEQDWAVYADQAHLKSNDTLLARTAAGAGVEVAGTHIVARRVDGGAYTADGQLIVNGGTFANSFPFILDNDLGATAQTWFLFRNLGSVKASIRANVYGSDFMVFATGSNVDRLQLDSLRLTPTSDNVLTLGTGSLRWSVVYAATGTINTSDEREKVWRGAATEAELRAAKRIAVELGFYQWADAVKEKGDVARFHFGARAQQVWAIMADEGLVDPIVDGLPGDTPYAFLCFDQWDETPEVPAIDEVCDDEGEIVVPAMPAKPAIPAGDRFGVRVDQLTLFLIAAQEQRIAALEAAL